MSLTLAESNRVVQGAIAKAEELGIKINVAVCDAGGRLVAFNRMDGAIWGGGIRQPGQGDSLGGLRPDQRCAPGEGRHADHTWDHRGGRRAWNCQPGRRTHYQERGCRGRLRHRRR